MNAIDEWLVEGRLGVNGPNARDWDEYDDLEDIEDEEEEDEDGEDEGDNSGTGDDRGSYPENPPMVL